MQWHLHNPYKDIKITDKAARSIFNTLVHQTCEKPSKFIGRLCKMVPIWQP